MTCPCELKKKPSRKKTASYALAYGPVGPALPAMNYSNCCPGPCPPCGPWTCPPNRCRCCSEWGCFGPFY
ncbi:uncharacterized protein [Drosophila tropicalis]|uniref:uncharacterized protein n=1 Tax=Drosophila tropicalis TaxID=46794 RepID=UPI0035AB9B57